MSPTSNASPAFAPHAFMHSGGLPSPGFGGPSVSPRGQRIFNDAAFSRIDPRIDGATLVGASTQDLEMRDTFPGGSQGITQMFDELTNQEDNDDVVRGGEQPGSVDVKGGMREAPERDPDREKWGETDDNFALFFDGE
jgi:histone demethylase JARID1